MLYIIRHGQTIMNTRQLLQGRSDHPLNETGREQAEEAGRRFREEGISFDLVYSSPLIRAKETALLAGDKEEVIIDKRLIEMDYGPYEGTDLKNLPPEILTFFSDFQNNPAPDGMEQLGSIVARAGAFLEEIKEQAKDRNILISTHAIAMKGLLEYLTPDSKGSYWSKYIGNCEVYITDVQDGNYTVPQKHSDQSKI